MPGLSSVAFTKEVRALQERYRSRAAYAKLEASETGDASLGPDEIEFVRDRDSFYLATVNSDGWPYIQHRGGPPGFLHVVNPKQLAFADYGGNKQYLSVGNLQTSDRVAMILIDYPTQSRLKIWGHARVLDLEKDRELYDLVRPPEKYPARNERLFIIDVVAWDWNCTQHITPRYTLEEIDEMLERHESKIADE